MHAKVVQTERKAKLFNIYFHFPRYLAMDTEHKGIKNYL